MDWKERGFTAEGWAIASAIGDVKSVLTDKKLSGERSSEPDYLDTEIDTGRIDLVENPETNRAKRHIVHANDVERVTF